MSPIPSVPDAETGQSDFAGWLTTENERRELQILRLTPQYLRTFKQQDRLELLARRLDSEAAILTAIH